MATWTVFGLAALPAGPPGAIDRSRAQRDSPRAPEDYDGPFAHSARLQVRACSSDRAVALRRALSVEAGDPLGGARVRLEEDPHDPLAFTIQVEAVDLVHLRAATNSFMKWLAAADASVDAAKPHNGSP